MKVLLKRIALLVITAAMMAVVAPLSHAQTTIPTPECGVKGSGAILVHEINHGVFDINVAKSGDVLFGGFRYSEVTPDGRRVCTIYSQSLTKVDVTGNTATVEALGYWNGIWANLTIWVLDDTAGDTFHILAVPRSPILILYEAQGPVVKGDIVVFGTPIPPQCFTKGDGAIAVMRSSGRNVGRFTFAAEKAGDAVKGTLNYVEFNPMVMSAMIRPIVRIYLPAVQYLRIVSPKEVIFGGRGMLNGRPALIEARVVDNLNPGTPGSLVKDEFFIRAMPLTSDSVSNIAYQAGGPLTSGDVVVIVRTIL